MQLCHECPNYKNCIKLCPDAEAYVNQDYVPKRELTFTELGITQGADVFSTEDDTVVDWENDSDKEYNGYTYNQVRIITLHKHDFSNNEIADIVGVSRRYVRKIVRRYKNGTISNV